MKTFATNRKARFDYSIEDTFEAGIVLFGLEVKSIRLGEVNIAEAYVRFDENDELYIINSHIQEYKQANTAFSPAWYPTRPRKLLLHARELNKIRDKIEREGYTAIPLKLYEKNGIVKCEVGIAKAKKKQDKRASVKDRDWSRDKARILKDN